MGKFDGRVALVTGASRGIGKAISTAFAEGGAKVFLTDIDEDSLIQTVEKLTGEGYSVLHQVTDVTDKSQVQDAVRSAISQFGRIDILVNNAGVTRDNLLFKMTDDDWNLVLDVHLRGSFNCCRAVQENMIKNKYGRIINISSTSALGNRGQANYATAKAGIQGFTKTLAIELGKFGVTTNAIAPGFIETDMTKATAARLGITFDELVTQSVISIPVGRCGKPEDIANAALFFAAEDSSFVTGQVLYVAGGPKV